VTTFDTEAARRFYDRMGRHHDRMERFEGRAKAAAVAALDLAPGLRVLDVGAGPGTTHGLLARAVEPSGWAVALDISPVMLRLVRDRTASDVCQGDVLNLPLAKASFDRVFCSYLLDLLPSAVLPNALVELRRVLSPGGRIAIVGMTDGTTPTSRIVVGAWRALYRRSPQSCGGCRPIVIEPLLRRGGFRGLHRRVVVERGLPSEILTANR